MTDEQNEYHFRLQSLQDTDTLGKALAEHLPDGTVIALNGTLGAGKTRLVEAIAVACGAAAADVTSPTFTLWQTYENQRVIRHIDAYRLADEDEFDQLGVYEQFDDAGLTFIEWADRVAGSLPRHQLRVQIEVTGETERQVTLAASGTVLAEALGKIANQAASLRV